MFIPTSLCITIYNPRVCHHQPAEPVRAKTQDTATDFSGPYQFLSEELEFAIKDIAKLLGSAKAQALNGEMLARYYTVRVLLNL